MTKQILIVEDEPDLMEITTSVVEKEGREISAVFEGSSAMDALTSKPFDLVILDLLIPEPDGFHILTWIRENEATQDLPVIIISASSQENTVKKVLSLGATKFISKPFKFEELAQSVKTVLGD